VLIERTRWVWCGHIDHVHNPQNKGSQQEGTEGGKGDVFVPRRPTNVKNTNKVSQEDPGDHDASQGKSEGNVEKVLLNVGIVGVAL
jgi:hypothetical protein